MSQPRRKFPAEGRSLVPAQRHAVCAGRDDYRFSLAPAGGAALLWGRPDLSTFGKAMANGFSVAAVTGKRDFMKVGSIEETGMERTFLLSTTHGAEMPGLGAFIETVRIYREEDVVGHLWRYGRQLFDGLRALAQEFGIRKHFDVDGSAISMNFVAHDRNGEVSPALRTLFMQELARHGVLMPWVAISQSHGPRELEMTLEASRQALRVVTQALEDGVERFLIGPAVKPVFRRFN